MSEMIALVLSIASGLALMGFHASVANVIATSLIVDASLAPLTAVIAYQHGRSVLGWTIAGFTFSAWALAAVLILITVRDARPSDNFPQSPDAA